MLSRLLLLLLVAMPQVAAADEFTDQFSAEDLARLLGTWDPAHCAESKLRLSPSFEADTIECLGGGAIPGSPSVRARGGSFSLVLDAHIGGGGGYTYQTPRQYFETSPMFVATSDWGSAEDGDNRFDYSTFRGDLKDDATGPLSCLALSRHSAPYEGRGWSKHLVVGIYCDSSYGQQPVPQTRIDQLIDAIEMDFE